MQAILLGDSYHGQVVELGRLQDVYRPSTTYRPRYSKFWQSADMAHACFVSSDLCDQDAKALVVEHIRSMNTAEQASHAACQSA